MRHARIGIAVGTIGLAMAVAGCQDLTTNGTSGDSTTTAKTAKHWTMPNLVGANLQTAQDRIQSVTGDPVFLTSSHDASGRHRMQVLDRDWKVCTQNIAPGTTFTMDAKIDFGAVKLAESCP